LCPTPCCQSYCNEMSTDLSDIALNICLRFAGLATEFGNHLSASVILIKVQHVCVVGG